MLLTGGGDVEYVSRSEACPPMHDLLRHDLGNCLQQGGMTLDVS